MCKSGHIYVVSLYTGLLELLCTVDLLLCVVAAYPVENSHNYSEEVEEQSTARG